jgi:hypothetical protein
MLAHSFFAGPAVQRLATTAAASTKPGISLMSQSPYVVKKGSFDLQLAIQVGGQTGDFVQVLAFDNLITRTAFDQALNGQYQGTAIYQPTVAVNKLTADPDGGYDLDIPVSPYSEQPPAGSLVPVFEPAGASAVYPVQVGLFDSDDQPVGAPIDTFLVYALGPESVTQLPPLSVAVVFPVTAAPNLGPADQIEALPAYQSSRLSSLVTALAGPRTSGGPQVDSSLELTPQSLDALALGSARDRATLAQLEQLVVGGDEVFPSTYVRRSIDDFEDSGLDSELDIQLKAGAGVFKADLGSSPATSPWEINGPVDAVTLNELSSLGVGELVLPSTDMTPLPASLTVNTFAQATQLALPGSPNAAVYGADTGLTADFNRTADPVLNADQLLAEMAMIQLETPGTQRGVVAMPPTGFTPSAAFVSTLLDGLAGNPLLSAVTVSKLFDDPHLQSGVVRQIPANELAGEPIDRSFKADAGSIEDRRAEVSGLAYLVPAGQANIEALPSQLLVAESSDITADQRRSILNLIYNDSKRITSQIDLPGPTSITLTSARSELPLTILASPTIQATVELDLSSDRLIFEAYSPPHGSCTLEGPTEEVCQLRLVTENTTLRVPVESRSPGVFPLSVTMTSPDGSLVLAHFPDTVRSTAISNVGIVLIVVALLSLAIWWVRDLRHGRRARRLIPAPADEVVLTSDPVIDEFFAEPAPHPDPGRTDPP